MLLLANVDEYSFANTEYLHSKIFRQVNGLYGQKILHFTCQPDMWIQSEIF